ncbi:MAG: flagellar hook-associated protein FlgL, partial [Pseudomonadota bacterium]
MRIGSVSFFEASQAGMQYQQSAIARLSEQIATGKKNLQPADDPVASHTAINLTNVMAVRSQYADNQAHADRLLKQQGVVLKQLRDSIITIRDTALQLSAPYAESQREYVAQQLQLYFDHIMNLANERDYQGNYLFAGTAVRTRPYVPFQPLDPGVTPPDTVANYTEVVRYQGDEGAINIAIDANRSVQVNEPGSYLFGDVFEAIYNLKQAVDVSRPNPAIPPVRDPETATQYAGDQDDSFTLTADDINTAVAKLGQMLDRLERLQTRVAGAQLEVDAARKSTASLLNQDKDALARLEEVDQAA